MTRTLDITLPPHLNRDTLLAALERVLDPELDESVLTLGFVESIEGDDAGNVTVCLRLPTYWCAANFSYLMASDARSALLEVEGVCSVAVKLGEHFVGPEVEAGTGTGRTFGETFPEGGPDSLEETRRVFLVKGFFSRQERLLRELKRSGLSFKEIESLRVGDSVPAAVDVRTFARYLERRGELALDCSESGPLIVDATGKTVAATELETYYVRARTTRLAMEASGSLCSAMLQSRNSNWTQATS